MTDAATSPIPPTPLEEIALRRDHRAGTIMRFIAVFGVAVSIVATAVAWEVLSDLQRSVRESLEVGEDATLTLADTIDVADTLVDAIDDGLVTIDSSLGAVDATIEDTAELATATSSLAETLPTSFDDVDAALATVETLGGTIDGALRAVSSIPFGPDYDPEVPLSTAVANVRDAFSPVGGDLRAIADDLDSFAGNSQELSDQIIALSDDVAAARRAVGDSADLLDEYRERAAEAKRVVVTSRADLDRSILAARVAAVLVGVLIAISQYVPWWFGTRLRDRSDTLIVGRASTVDDDRRTLVDAPR